MPRAFDKREKLIEAACDEVYSRGYANVTLAIVAERSGVPLGNVYYYFKTKDALAQAVIDSYQSRLEDKIARCERRSQPLDRLRRFLTLSLERKHVIARLGCPFGSLAQEFEKQGPLAERSRHLLERLVSWSAEQFADHGYPSREARALGLDFQARLQGACLMAHNFGDPRVFTSLIRRARDWLDALPPLERTTP